METLGIASVASITVICYLLGMLFKALGWDQWIPTLMGIWGCVFGIIAYILKIPDFPASDILTAMAVGIVSGLAATGINQMYKQAGKAEGGD